MHPVEWVIIMVVAVLEEPLIISNLATVPKQVVVPKIGKMTAAGGITRIGAIGPVVYMITDAHIVQGGTMGSITVKRGKTRTGNLHLEVAVVEVVLTPAVVLGRRNKSHRLTN